MNSSNSIQFVGHACAWIKLSGQSVFIDANFSDKILGSVSRKTPLGINVADIPKDNILLVTHAHYDHLDLFSYKYFYETNPIVCPPGIGSLIKRFLNNPVHEKQTGENSQHGKITVTAVPTKHYGFRLSGLRYTRCNGYIITDGTHTIYHPGDTAYGPHFKEIGQKYKIDVALLPIGAYRPQWMMKSRHMGPDEALQAFEDLGAKKMIPIHWGSFKIATDGLDEAIGIFRKRTSEKPDSSRYHILNPGESLVV